MFLLGIGLFAPEDRQSLRGNIVFSTKEANLVEKPQVRYLVLSFFIKFVLSMLW